MPDNGESKSYKTLAGEWLLQQGVSTVLLFLILLSGYRVSMYAVETAIPAHLKAIQDGYRDIQDRQSGEIKIMLERFGNAEAKQNALIESNTAVTKDTYSVLKEIRDSVKKEKP